MYNNIHASLKKELQNRFVHKFHKNNWAFVRMVVSIAIDRCQIKDDEGGTSEPDDDEPLFVVVKQTCFR